MKNKIIKSILTICESATEFGYRKFRSLILLTIMKHEKFADFIHNYPLTWCADLNTYFYNKLNSI